MALRGLVDRKWLDENRDRIDRFEVAGVRHCNISDAAVELGEVRCPHVKRNAYYNLIDDSITEPEPDCHKHCRTMYRVWMYTGRVLAEYEENGYHDSDFYCIAWDGERLVHELWGTTRCASTGWGCTVDATDEVKAEAREHLEQIAFEDFVALAEKEARTPKVGRRVRSWKGRAHTPIEGTVFWIGKYRPRGTYSDWAAEERVGIETDDGERTFTPLSRAEVVDPEPVDLERCRWHAKRVAQAGHWRHHDIGWYG